MTDCPAAPDQTVWWHVAGTVAAVLDRLRLMHGDIDEPRLRACVASAGYMINDRLDRVDPVASSAVPANLQYALEEATVLLYRRNRPVRAQSGQVLDIGDPDPLANLLAVVEPNRQRWGVG